MPQAKTALSPLVLRERPKAFTSDGGHRALLPESVLEKYAHLIGDSGILEELECLPPDPCDLVHVCVARLRTSLRSSRVNRRTALRAPCVGKGMTEAQARASAIGEAVERCSGIFRGDEVRIKASYQKLGGEAIHPNAWMNFSARQYRERDESNRRESEHNWVPEPFEEHREIEWTPVWSLTEERRRYVATAQCYFGYPYSAEHDFCRAHSNGSAAGANLEEAVLQGFFEVVERDAVALWWYNRARRPSVDLGSFGEPYFSVLGEFYGLLGRDMLVLDVSADFPIPVFAAVSKKRKSGGDLLLGFGAHLEPRLAIVRALTEMNQSLVPATAGGKPRFFVDELVDGAFLEPDRSRACKTCGDYRRLDSKDLLEDVRTCVGLARERSLETLVLDQTRPDIGMHAVKVIVPGMRLWWARFAPGRLYDVPVLMRWQALPLPEEELNPCHLAI
jgi:thiazole/oxazole-forming peptide maturase SagD family component